MRQPLVHMSIVFPEDRDHREPPEHEVLTKLLEAARDEGIDRRSPRSMDQPPWQEEHGASHLPPPVFKGAE